MESLSPSLLPVLFQNQSAHRSSIIQSVSLHCFSLCFHIHHLASAHLVELDLFLEASFSSAHDGEVLLSLRDPLMPLRSNQKTRAGVLYILYFVHLLYISPLQLIINLIIDQSFVLFIEPRVIG